MPVDSSTKTLLIVDDSKVSRMLIRTHILSQRPEWIISEAACGEDAIALVANDLPDFCTMDINMPGISGTEAAEHILANHPSVKIVIFSANIQETHQERARSLGTILVAKPVTEKSIALALDYFDNAQ
ncbi:MAG: response regulator [Methylobacter sp.]|nr:response regulator [Methylobacter sp.]